MKNTRNLCFHLSSSPTVTPTQAGQYYVLTTGVLETLIEALAVASDGRRIKLKKLRLAYIIASAAHFSMEIAMVQTAGTITSGKDLGPGELDLRVAMATNDVFGLERLKPAIMANYLPDGSNLGIRGVCNIPQKYIDIINRGVFSERDQSLSIVLSGCIWSANSITANCVIDGEYVADSTPIRPR